MKKVFLFIFSLVLSLSVKAQTPTFEQTVSYIKNYVVGRVMYPGDLDSYSRTEGYKVEDIDIQKNGAIEIKTTQQNHYNVNNNFKISFNIFDLVEKVDYPDGIRAYKFLVHFNGLNVSQGYGIAFATDADAEKVSRAFRYLKKLCVKDNDLFSKPTETEKKPSLSREETIDYINNLLASGHVQFAYTERIGFSGLHQNDYSTVEDIYYRDAPLEYSDYKKSYTISFKHEMTAACLTEDHPNAGYNYVATSTLKIGPDISFEQSKYNTELIKKVEGKESGSQILNGVTGMPQVVYVKSGETSLMIYTGFMDDKKIERLKKAFLRLAELNKPGKDPFDN